MKLNAAQLGVAVGKGHKSIEPKSLLTQDDFVFDPFLREFYLKKFGEPTVYKALGAAITNWISYLEDATEIPTRQARLAFFFYEAWKFAMEDWIKGTKVIFWLINFVVK